ncbi:hypothetical protein [Haliovirga abyssi]|uniref:Glycoside hydrolase family 57 N-terminal domain-containing protein n=1 Tax=Haliovirga abyssi TaxID=2996794 RepID=A0AAU9DIR3_9FUSO|nr:hypothetical protein [Haliovirga abyssi]BDU50654.1 hypothetical protein HLVA_12230 [Haliovirga abyssi]
MDCPKCGSEIKNGICEKCEKRFYDILLEESELLQVKRDYDKALEYLKEARKLAKTEDEENEVERVIKGIQFSRFDLSGDILKSHNVGDSKKTIKKESYIYSGFKKMLVISLLIFLIFGGIEIGKILYYKNIKISDKVINNRKLDIAFLFHLNQGSNPHADIADKVTYYNLIKTLRKHPSLKFNLHISGTLIQDLLWYNPETIKLIKDGIKSGQFEILGSTYAQNVMYSTDEQSNIWQIEEHKRIIKKVFGVNPVGFWNAERTWNQNITKLVLKYGYKYTFVENHILKESGAKDADWVLRTTENGKLTIVNDDTNFLPLVNNAIDTGDNEVKRDERGANLTEKSKNYKKLFKYIRKIYEKDKKSDFLLNYADDAEVTGLWDFSSQKNPEWDFENLDFLLTKLENKKWIKLVKYSDILSEKKAEDITPIKDGYASWMEKAAKGEGQYSEKGYDGWFDFNKNSPKLAYYRKLHKKYEKFINEYKNSDKKNIKKLVALAKENFLSHQFEFGCTGIAGTDEEWKNGRRLGVWENIKTVSVIEEAVKDIEENIKNKIYEKDVNMDNIKEVIVVNNDNFYVFSKARGGRLLFWYDLKTGKEIVGGELGVQLGEEYYDGNFPTQPFSIKNNIRFLNGMNSVLNYFEKRVYLTRVKGLNEKFEYENSDNNNYKISDYYKADMEVEYNEDYLIFTADNYKKEIKFTKNGFEVDYLNISNDVKNINVKSEFEPGYFTIVNNGKKVLDIKNSNNKIEILNKKVNIGIEITVPKDVKIKNYYSLFGIVAEFDLKKEYKILVDKIE